MNNTILEIGEKNIDYYRSSVSKFKEYKGYMTYIFSIAFIIISTLFFALQAFQWDPLIQLEKFKRIKKNIGNWQQLIIEKTDIEINKGKAKALQLKPSSFSYACYDYGNFYAALKLNQTSFLPEFILRGNGDVWKFRKADNKDIPAMQFCEYIILKGNYNTAQCGTDMFDKLGYSGYFEFNHPCQTALDVLTR